MKKLIQWIKNKLGITQLEYDKSRMEQQHMDFFRYASRELDRINKQYMELDSELERIRGWINRRERENGD
jgi:hypothetical protein